MVFLFFQQRLIVQALLIVDLQNDFMSKGALEVAGAEDIVPVINALIPRFSCVIASKDWHPPKHGSFASTYHKKVGEKIGDQILWPDHCVQGTFGANFSPLLSQEEIKKIFYKGATLSVDSYSAFFDDNKKNSTGLDEFLKREHISKIFITGLVLEYCITATALDGIRLGYKVAIVREGVKALVSLEEQKKILKSLENQQVEILSYKEIPFFITN